MNIPSSDQQRTRVIYYLIPLFLTFSVTSYYFLYGNNGVLISSLTSDVITLKWTVNLTLRYGLGILRDSALIWMLLRLRKRLYVSDALHFWLISFLGGLFLITLIYLTNYVLPKASLYGQLFMLTRGAIPIVSGIFLLILIQPLLAYFSEQTYSKYILTILLCLPLIFNQDIFGFNHTDNGMSISALLVLGIFALIIKNQTVKVHWLFILPIIGVISFLFMGILEGQGGIPLTNASRFVGLMSPLSIIPSVILVQLIECLPDSSAKPSMTFIQRIAPFFVLFSAILMGSTNYNGFASSLYGKLRSTIQFMHIFWLVGTALFFTIIAILVALLASFAIYTKLWKQMTEHWRITLDEAFVQLLNWRPLLRRLWHNYWRPILAITVLLIVELFSSLLMNQSLRVEGNIWQSDRNLNIFAFIFTQLFSRQIVATFILVVSYWLLISLTNRYWLSLISVSSFTVFFAVANRIKIQYRSEPVVVADFAELKQLPQLLKMINPLIVMLSIITFFVIIIMIVLIERRAQNAHQSATTRFIKFAFALIFLWSLGALNHSYSPTRTAMQTLGADLNNINPIRYAQWYGPVMQYLTGLDVNTMTTPKNYSDQSVKKLVRKYQKRATLINKTRFNEPKDTTVIFNLSESFSDPTNLTDLEVNKEPAPYIQNLKRQTTSGEMMSFGYGGGTANMEYMSLTGLSIGGLDSSLTTPYTQLIPKLASVPNVGNNFSYSSAIHPYIGGFYNRIAVYQKLNFNKFAYLGSHYKIIDQKKIDTSPYLSDETAYNNALSQINKKKSGQFINLITIQNHLPFSDWYSNKQFTVTAKKPGFLSDKTSVETYAQGINYTDKAVKQFRESLDKLDKPVIWVFYGDHLPGLYNTFSNESEKYQTDYFVYANEYARNHGAKTKLNKAKFVGPNDFIALAYEQGNLKLNAYNALLTDLQSTLPAQWMKITNSRESSTKGTTFITETGKRINYDNLNSKQKRIYHDYQLLLYDINVGKQYSLKYGILK